jgi:ribonuclease VapC
MGENSALPARSHQYLLIESLGLAMVAFTPDHARAAQTAFMTYGKGRHPAALNFGDCMSYAVAKVAGRALLFTGGEFALTDVAVA